MANQILVIFPYKYEDTWMFDDEKLGIQQEPFVCGIPEMFDLLVKNIPNAERGFKLFFSASPFPGYQAGLNWLREEYGGHWYRWDIHNLEGWLCPVLFRYFSEPPPKLYCQAEDPKSN
jgi:hypothetical protein